MKRFHEKCAASARCFRIVVALAAVAWILGALGGSASAQPKFGDPEYRLKKGDKVRIVVPDRPTLSRDLVIGENGAIMFPLAGDVVIDGLTTAEAHEKIFQTLHDYYPSLTREKFTVEALASVVVYVSGEVATPGRYTFGNAPTLWEAIREAGGPTGGAALDVVRVVRSQNGASVTETVNVLSAIEQGRTDTLPRLNDGDTVVLSSTTATYVGSSGVNIVGAVVSPGFYRLQGEHDDVMSAVLLAGGFQPRAALGEVKIVRLLEDGSTVTEKLQLDKYTKSGDPAFNPPLRPGDTIVVPEQNAWAYQFKTNFALILSVVATAATVFLVIDRINNP